VTNLKFDKENTALLVIDLYNDFISEGGKLWDRIKTVAEANDCNRSHVAVADRSAEDRDASFLCDASSILSR
jgi:nicotinamidase-related amidase